LHKRCNGKKARSIFFQRKMFVGREGEEFYIHKTKNHGRQLKNLHYNLSSITDYVYESWPLMDNLGKMVRTWSDVARFKEYPGSVLYDKSSPTHFLGLQVARVCRHM
jgi:hypothetical protein